ncbi:hypothetical protein GOODEAATRI_022153 [Goodea atripinnis]|uniref:Uncharacterized protein n=1 Tax=Goodea atripinnis TaxID=208336 RepID=A0ABV0PG87_9TELE
MSFVLRNLSSDQLSYSGDHLHSSKNITNRTNQALQFALQLLPVPDALLASHGLPFSDKLCSPARSLSDAAHGLTDLDPRNKPSRNKPLHRRPYLPPFLSDQRHKPSPFPPHSQ